MCVLAESPKKSWDGETEQILNQLVRDTTGKIYCESCFNRHYKKICSFILFSTFPVAQKLFPGKGNSCLLLGNGYFWRRFSMFSRSSIH